MKALCWHGTNDIRCDNVPDPKIEEGRDVIIKVTSCAICGSDLHLMDGLMPTMKSGDILGHEFMGEVIETGSAHTKFRKGDRIVVPFNINCGECRQCKLGNYSVCQRSNRNAAMAAEQFGYTTAGLFGYSHLTGGYAGGQAEYVRVPMADVAPMKVPDGMTDEEVLFLTDIFPTGYQAAEQAGIKGGEIVAIWGTGPVGLFAIQSAKVLGAERIIAIETVPERIAMARKAGATDIVDFAKEDVYERIKEISKGEGADVVIDCVGMEASPGHGQGGLVSAVKEKVMPAERTYVLDQAIKAVRPCGVVSVPGVYGGPVSVNMGSIVQKGLRLCSGQTHVKRYLEPLTKLIQEKKVDTTFLITHRSTDLADGPRSLSDLQKQEGRLRESRVPPRVMTSTAGTIGRLARPYRHKEIPMVEKTLSDLFLAQLKDIYYAEKKIFRTLPKMVKAAQAPELKQAFTAHREETQGQIERLEQVFEMLGKRPQTKPCEAINGIVAEGEETIEDFGESAAIDTGLVAAGQAVEHYEMARYGALIAWAGQLGMPEAAALLNQTLQEEMKAERLLTQIAKSKADKTAATKMAA